MPLSRFSKTTLSLALSALLAACGGGDGRVSGPAGQVARGLPFRDLEPHDWRGLMPSHYAVHGIDLSRYQTSVDWRQVAGAGIAFAYVKATEGADYADPSFRQHWYGAQSAGIRHGAYHFYYFCRTATEQAEWFIRNVPKDINALPPVLDLEWNHQSRTCKKRPDGETVRAEAQIFLDRLEAHYGKRPVVYTTPDFYRETGIGRIGRTQFWLRSVAGHPREVYPGAHWTFWQYTGTGVVPGISGPVDLNAFAGSQDLWHAWSSL